MAQERPDEQLARRLMAETLGVPVLRHDDGSEPSMYDFEFVLDDGRNGAAEMTSIADRGDKQWLAHARYDRARRIPGSDWAWMVKRRGRHVAFGELMGHLSVLAPLAERRGQSEIHLLVKDPEVRHLESARWFREAGVDVYAFRSTSDPGRVSFAGDNKAASGEHLALDLLLDWLEAELADAEFDADFAKINNSGCVEQHLVLRIDIGNRIPDDAAIALLDRSATLPTRPPSIPGRRLTGLWLIPEFGWSAILWTASSGWRRTAAPPIEIGLT